MWGHYIRIPLCVCVSIYTSERMMTVHKLQGLSLHSYNISVIITLPLTSHWVLCLSELSYNVVAPPMFQTQLSQFHHSALLQTIPVTPGIKWTEIREKKTVLPTEEIHSVKQFMKQVINKQNTVSTILSCMYTECDVSATLEKLLQNSNFLTISSFFSLYHIFIFCLSKQWIFTLDLAQESAHVTADWWVKKFGYNATQSQIQPASTVIMDHYYCNSTHKREDDGQHC